MKITEIGIDSFGVWREQTLPLRDAGLTLFFGPNEAGKTTLMRLIRGVLYGFEPLRIAAGRQTNTGSMWSRICSNRRPSGPSVRP